MTDRSERDRLNARVTEIVRAVGSPPGLIARAEWLAKNNPTANDDELAAIIRAEIERAMRND